MVGVRRRCRAFGLYVGWRSMPLLRARRRKISKLVWQCAQRSRTRLRMPTAAERRDRALYEEAGILEVHRDLHHLSFALVSEPEPEPASESDIECASVRARVG